MRNFGIVCATLAVVFTTGNGIKCYSCFDCDTVNGSTPTTTCAEPPQTAPSNAKGACFKGTGKVNGVQTIARGCGWSTAEFCQQETHVLLSGEYCYCNKDLCNEASIMKLNVVLMIFLAGILAKIYA
uniref:uncharacterized protein LOC120347758 isoform X2 n=1 Tax=Styela clava TaxID=7725 RepID=UPI00193ABEC1|nr:uncharacterized protein LOC120347758 isoform X2 [Styela clava]